MGAGFCRPALELGNLKPYCLLNLMHPGCFPRFKRARSFPYIGMVIVDVTMSNDAAMGGASFQEPLSMVNHVHSEPQLPTKP